MQHYIYLKFLGSRCDVMWCHFCVTLPLLRENSSMCLIQNNKDYTPNCVRSFFKTMTCLVLKATPFVRLGISASIRLRQRKHRLLKRILCNSVPNSLQILFYTNIIYNAQCKFCTLTYHKDWISVVYKLQKPFHVSNVLSMLRMFL